MDADCFLKFSNSEDKAILQQGKYSMKSQYHQAKAEYRAHSVSCKKLGRNNRY